ncbi:hypothetical protein KIN20_030831 [Parelaphostrongylus tenuis]|uniref:Uncharacterized protein n=1 Tax=Parelaphostrongylus tenuis TaxID=148309 RepID=A0AAD5R5Z0_PARTN|nr:hypothetical protein KIN20_030831 [Parelaphostrongylus tenuis]
MPQISETLGDKNISHKQHNLHVVQLVPVRKLSTSGVRTNAKREADEDLAELNKQIIEEHGKDSGDDVTVLKEKCMRIAPIAQKLCDKKALTKENVARCAAYFRDCSRFFSHTDPLYSIANSFSSAVDLTFPRVDVNGIPFYPINEEGSVGVGVITNVPFGSWGGGFSNHVGVRDYWSQYQEAGGNWYEGRYGYKNGWSVPLVQSLGVEGGQHNVVSAPLNDPENVGNVAIDNGYGVGGYYGHNDHAHENWRKGDVLHTFGVGSPFVGAGFNTGQAVAFPSLDTFLNAGRK